jgi:hypothetical protein
MFSDKPNLKRMVIAGTIGVILAIFATVFLTIRYPDMWLFALVSSVFALVLVLINGWIPVFFVWQLHKQYPTQSSFDEKYGMLLSASPRGDSDEFRLAFARKQRAATIARWGLTIALLAIFISLIFSRVLLP